MYRERKEDLSLYYWLKNLFLTTSYITIVDGFPTDNLVLPTISVDAVSIDPRPHELGNRTRVNTRVWRIDVFAKNKSQRDEIGYKILNGLIDPIPVYDYDEGFPPDVSPTQIGTLFIGDRRMEIIRVLPELVETLYYRATITFVAELDLL